MSPGLHRAHHDFAGIDSDTNLHTWAALHRQVPAPAPQLVPHRKRCVRCALRMIFMSDRCAKQRENSVTGRLDNVPVVAMNRIDHELQRWIDNRASYFGIEIAHQLGGALDIGEQRGHALALAFDGLWAIYCTYCSR